MWIFDNKSSGMWLYLCIHGSYGFSWLIKDKYFADQSTLKEASIGSHLVLVLLLAFYWLIPVPLAMGYGVSHPSKFRILSIVFMYALGLILMMGSDYQKH